MVMLSIQRGSREPHPSDTKWKKRSIGSFRILSLILEVSGSLGVFDSVPFCVVKRHRENGVFGKPKTNKTCNLVLDSTGRLKTAPVPKPGTPSLRPADGPERDGRGFPQLGFLESVAFGKRFFSKQTNNEKNFWLPSTSCLCLGLLW